MKPETAGKLLEENRRIYNEIARDFSKTRQGKLQELEPLARFVKSGDRLLDVGSGSGRLFEVLGNRDIEFYGIDSSAEMIKICQEKSRDFSRAHFEVADILNTQFPDNYFDIIYVLATLHHVPSRELRVQALQKLYRLLKPGGKLVMTNWYWWRLPAILLIFRVWFKKILYTIISYSHILKNVRIIADLDFGDIFVPWGKKGLRYYHSFRKKELKNLLQKAGFVKINQYLTRKRGDHWGKRVNLVTIAEKSL